MTRMCGSGNRESLQLGLGGQITTGTFAFQGSFGVAFDTHFNVALYGSGGFGLGVGAGGDLGLTAAVTNAPTIQDLAGISFNISAGGGWVLGGSVDGFRSVARNGNQIYGGGATAGVAAGETSFGGTMFTSMSSSLNLQGRPTC